MKRPALMLCFGLFVGAASAQDPIDLTDYRECQDCELGWVRVAALGDATGDGIVESEHPRLARSSSGVYAMFGESHIKLFDADGRFLRRIGSEGGGSGEYRRMIDLEARR